MSSVKSANNYTIQPLGVGNIYVGSFDSVLQYSTAILSCLTDTTAEIVLYQTMDKTNLISQAFQVLPNVPFTKTLSLSYPYMYATVRNTSLSVQTFLNFEIIYRQVSVASQTSASASTRGQSVLWSTPSCGVNGVSNGADLSSVSQTVLTLYGNSSVATDLTVQFSNDGVTWYSSQYSYSLTSPGSWGFALQACPYYIRLMSSADGAINAIANWA